MKIPHDSEKNHIMINVSLICSGKPTSQDRFVTFLFLVRIDLSSMNVSHGRLISPIAICPINIIPIIHAFHADSYVYPPAGVLAGILRLIKEF